jgi:putative resolvase
MKLSADARSLGVSDRTAWRWFKAGKVAGFQADPGAILVTEAIVEAVLVTANPKTVIDTRVSAAENQDHLEGQAKGQKDSCAAKGYPVAAVVQEIGSGVNDPRPKRLKWLTDPTVGQMVVEHKDRLTRFGFIHRAMVGDARSQDGGHPSG